LLDGSVVWPGLAVDTDLRWTLLLRLVATGRTDAAAVERELDRDSTATGERRAAAGRALVPTVEAKEAAWQAAVVENSLPNALLGATVAGMSQPDQRELMRGFVDRYFDAIPDVYATRTNETAQTIAIGLYPSWLVEPQTVTRSEKFLERSDQPPALRRMVAEGRDSVVRALRAQEFDAQG
jgi:aminopeptidase N